MSSATRQAATHQAAALTAPIAVPLGDAALPAAAGTPAAVPAPIDAAAPQPDRRGPARKVALGVLVVFGAIMAFHVLTDQLAPSSSTGSVTATTTLMAPRVAGQVSAVFVLDNQSVKAGEPLFALDPRPFDLTVRQAQAALDTALQTVDASSASLGSLRSKVAQAKANLLTMQAGADRSQALFDKGLSSQAALDTVNSQLVSAETALQVAEADLASNEKKLGGGGMLNPQVAAAQVQLEQAQLNQQFATVTAPADGVITNLRLTPGQYVNAGSPVLTFIEDSAPWITLDLRENQLANIDVGDPASIVFDAAPGRTFRGVVRGVAWGIDPGRTVANGLPQNLATTRWFEPARSIPVQLQLAEGVEWPRNVRVGSKANALIFTGGDGNPVAWLSGGLQSVQSLVSILY